MNDTVSPVESRLPEFGEHVEVGPSGLQIKDGATFDDCVALIEKLDATRESSCWWIGDALNQTERRFSAEYDTWASKTGLALGTLKTYRSVAGKYDTSNRLDALAFSHHYAVAGLAPALRDKVLKAAAVPTKAGNNPWPKSLLERFAAAVKKDEFSAAGAKDFLDKAIKNKWQGKYAGTELTRLIGEEERLRGGAEEGDDTSPGSEEEAEHQREEQADKDLAGEYGNDVLPGEASDDSDLLTEGATPSGFLAIPVWAGESVEATAGWVREVFDAEQIDELIGLLREGGE